MDQTPQASTSTSSSSTAGPSTTKSIPKAKPVPVKEEQREFTPVQAALVKRVRSCKISNYYEILGVEKGCDDSAVKKAYRKVS